MRQVYAQVDDHDVNLRIVEVEDVGRSAVTLEHHNIISRGDDFVYFDVGRWGGSDRYFGVVYGDREECHVVLCTYTGEEGRVHNLPGQISSGPIPTTISSFLNNCRSRVVDCARFQTIDTAGKLYLLLGDLHIPIVNHLCTASTHRCSTNPEVPCRVDQNYMRDLAPDSLTDFFNLRGLSNSGLVAPYPQLDRMVLDNIDEWYECYLANDIFTNPSSNVAAQDLQRFISLALNWQPSDGSRGSRADRAPIHFVQLGDMYELWVGLKRLFEGTPASQREVRIAHPPCTRRGGFVDRCVNYRSHQCRTRASEDVIRDWIGEVHENNTIEVNGRQESLCRWLHESAQFRNSTWLVGNHDCYLRPLSTSLGLPRRYMNFCENHMLIEHGHEGDAYNRDGSSTGHDITQGGAFLWNLRPISALGAEDQRRAFLSYSVRKYLDPDQDFVFFGMAHTHLPYLAVVNVNESYD